MVTYMAKMSNLCTAQQVNCSQTAVLGVLYLTGALNACMKRKIQRSMLSTVTLNYFGAPTLFEPILSTPTSLTEFLHFPDLICYNPWEDEVLCSIYVKVRWEGEKTKQKNLHNNSSISWVVFFFFPGKKESRENNLVYCSWMKVLLHKPLTSDSQTHNDESLHCIAYCQWRNWYRLF